MARILYINDCHRDQTLASIALRSAGHQFADAADGEEALATARLTRPDCIIVNPNVSIISGDELLRRLAMIAPSARFVILGCGLRKQTVRRAMQSGAAACLSRPFEMSDLIEAVREALAADARAA